jgi:hypothetical protein
MQVDTRDGNVRVARRGPNLGQRAFAGQGVADERVPPVVNGERAEASEAAHRRLFHDQSRVNSGRFSDNHGDVGRNVRKPRAYTTNGSPVAIVEVDVATPATATKPFPLPDCLLTGPIGFGHTM